MLRALLSALTGLLPLTLVAQDFVPNYDESKVPAYVLPDPLITPEGKAISSPAEWEWQRIRILRLFAEEMFGVSPAWDGQMKVEELSRDDMALDGKALRREVKLTLTRGSASIDLIVLTVIPKSTTQAPMFVGLNFYGNHTLLADEDIAVTTSWIRNNAQMGYENNRATASSRGMRRSNWPVEEIVARGYGLATVYYGDIDPDYDDGFENGVHALYSDQVRNEHSWGAVAAWAWGISRIVDYLETEPSVDMVRLAVIGHSRLGKAALWAAVVDDRFAMAISNNSGCGGAAISRRRFGETVWRINTAFPHWFAKSFQAYNDREDNLPFDQHTLVALFAPKPLYIASGEEDRWADPRGEFLAAVEATPVYRIFDKEGMPATTYPAVNQPVMGTLGYHVRSGGHGMLYQDWMHYLDFADKHWK